MTGLFDSGMTVSNDMIYLINTTLSFSHKHRMQSLDKNGANNEIIF